MVQARCTCPFGPSCPLYLCQAPRVKRCQSGPPSKIPHTKYEARRFIVFTRAMAGAAGPLHGSHCRFAIIARQRNENTLAKPKTISI